MTTTAPRLAAATVLALFAACAAHAQTAASHPSAAAAPASASRLAHSDASFMEKAAHAGLAEIESGKLAVDKGTNTQVKGFAQQMVDDHGKANEELKTLAASKGVQLPSEPSLAQKAKLKLLSASDGSSFDHRYADTMGVAAHRDTIRLFQKAATQAKDADVKAFAQKMVPTLQHHLEMAKEMKASVDKVGKGKAASAAASR